MYDTIAAFTEAHLDAAAHLYVAVFNAPPWNDHWTDETARRHLADTLHTPNASGYVAQGAEIDGFVLGYGEPWFDGTHFYLKELCVRPERQRQGIGTRLLSVLESALREQGVRRVYLLTMQEGMAAPFYAKHGYYRSPKMLLMARRL